LNVPPYTTPNPPLPSSFSFFSSNLTAQNIQ
jgi:hypothetical protein